MKWLHWYCFSFQTLAVSTRKKQKAKHTNPLKNENERRNFSFPSPSNLSLSLSLSLSLCGCVSFRIFFLFSTPSLPLFSLYLCLFRFSSSVETKAIHSKPFHDHLYAFRPSCETDSFKIYWWGIVEIKADDVIRSLTRFNINWMSFGCNFMVHLCANFEFHSITNIWH